MESLRGSDVWMSAFEVRADIAEKGRYVGY